MDIRCKIRTNGGLKVSKCKFDINGLCKAIACFSKKECGSRDFLGNPKYE